MPDRPAVLEHPFTESDALRNDGRPDGHPPKPFFQTAHRNELLPVQPARNVGEDDVRDGSHPAVNGDLNEVKGPEVRPDDPCSDHSGVGLASRRWRLGPRRIGSRDRDDKARASEQPRRERESPRETPECRAVPVLVQVRSRLNSRPVSFSSGPISTHSIILALPPFALQAWRSYLSFWAYPDSRISESRSFVMASATVGREGSPPLQRKRDAAADRPAARAGCNQRGSGVEQERILASAALGVSDDRPLGSRSSAEPRPSADATPGSTRNRPPLSSAERSRRGPVPQDGDRPRRVVPSRVDCGAHGQRSTAPQSWDAGVPPERLARRDRRELGGCAAPAVGPCASETSWPGTTGSRRLARWASNRHAELLVHHTVEIAGTALPATSGASPEWRRRSASKVRRSSHPTSADFRPGTMRRSSHRPRATQASECAQAAHTP